MQQSLLKNKTCFPFPPWIIQDTVLVFSSRRDKNMSLVWADTKGALENRRKFLQSSGIDFRDLVCAKQIHASNVKYIKEEDRGGGALSYESSIAGTDAFITDKRNTPLAIFTADCLSIFLYDSNQRAIGLVHAGWRSTKENIAAKTVKSMQEGFGTQIKDLSIVFGPRIKECCYEVDGQFKEFFSFGLASRSGRYYLDLAGINKKQFLDLGVREDNIFDCGICTSCRNQEFFSYRKEGKDCGRMISVMILK